MRQPDDPGPDPLDEPDPFAQVRVDVKIRVYLALIVLVIIATAFAVWVRDADAQEAVPFEEPCPAEAVQPCALYNQTLVWIQTGNDRKLSWSQHQPDVDTMVLEYDLEILEFPPKDPQVPVTTATTPEAVQEFIWIPGRAGTYWARVRTCRTDIPQDGQPIDGSDPEQRGDGSWILCSIWATSIDPTYTDPARYPRGFIYHATIPPATGGGIE